MGRQPQLETYLRTRKRLRKLKKRHRKLRKLEYESEMRELLQVSPGGIPEAEQPGVDGLPRNGDYSDRGPLDAIISGPVGKKVDGSKAPGRWFADPWDALAWAEEKYGRENVRLIETSLEEGTTRWAVLVKNLRKR